MTSLTNLSLRSVLFLSLVLFVGCEQEAIIPLEQEAITNNLMKSSSLHDQIAASSEFEILITTHFFDYGYGLDPTYPHGSRPQSSYTEQEVADMYQISTGALEDWYEDILFQYNIIVAKYPLAANFTDNDWSIVAENYLAANNNDEDLANARRKDGGCVAAAGARYFLRMGGSLAWSATCPPCGVATFLVSAGLFAYEYSNC